MATYELVQAKAQAAKQAAAKLAVTSTAVKNAALLAMAAALEAQQSEILAANERDMTAAAAKGMKKLNAGPSEADCRAHKRYG